LKNVALNVFARRHGRTPLNLIVDNDTAKTAVVRMPADGHLVRVPFDHWQGEIPYEERRVLDEKSFAGFPEAAAPYYRKWPFAPILPEFWSEVRRQARRPPLMGERLAAARRSFERCWGVDNFELPLSRLCGIEPFAWFVCHLLEDLPRFHAIYNAT